MFQTAAACTPASGSGCCCCAVVASVAVVVVAAVMKQPYEKWNRKMRKSRRVDLGSETFF